MRAAVLALAIGTLIGRPASPASIGYTTRGDIRPSVSGDGAADALGGPDVLRFQGTAGTIDGSAPFRLGEFVVDAPAGWSGTTYHDAAFAIDLETAPTGAVIPKGPGEAPVRSVTIEGVLDGTIAPGRSDLSATVRGIEPTPMAYIPENPKQFLLDLPYPVAALRVDRPPMLHSPAEGGRTTLWARINPVPEPGTILLFLTAAAGLRMRRRLRARG